MSMTAIPVPQPCCIPSNARFAKLTESIARSLDRPRATSGSLDGMIRLEASSFLMGSDSSATFPHDGEGPVLEITLSAFYIAACAVTNRQFAEFVRATGYCTEAERFGWSFVFRNHVRHPETATAAEKPWWLRVQGAGWSHPEGPDSCASKKDNYPAVHVSWNDALAYCDWAGFRLPTEAEWEYASRGGLSQNAFPWGDELTPGGQHKCNVWQGEFPSRDSGEDGFIGVAPVDAFAANKFGLFNSVGNTWEWCADFFDVIWRADASGLNPAGPPLGSTRVLKGGSFLCHESYCNRYRNSARIGNTPETSTGHIGFRVARDV